MAYQRAATHLSVLRTSGSDPVVTAELSSLVARFEGGLDESSSQALTLVLVVMGLLGYPVLVETATRGLSLGKLAAGLRVVRDDGGPIRFRQALVRGLLGVVEIYTLPFIALIASLSSRRGKRLGDQLAGTYVIRTRTPVYRTPPPEMPPFPASWASRTGVRSPDRR